MKISISSWFLLILLSLVWGSSFILIKRGLVAFSPAQVGYIRIFISFLALLPLAIVHFRGLKRETWFWILAVGFLGSGIPPFLFAAAQVHIDSAVAGILNSLTAIFTFVIGIMIFQTKFGWMKLLGVLVAFSGGAVIILFRTQGTLELANLYGLLIVVSTLCYGTSANIVKSKLQNINSVQIGALAFVVIGPIAGILLFSGDFVEVMQSHSYAWRSLLAITVLAFFGTAMASVLFFRLIKQTNALFAANVTYLINIVAIGWGVYDKETIGLWVITGMLLILGGVYLSSKDVR